jgi:flagellar biosynthesis protein FlhG
MLDQAQRLRQMVAKEKSSPKGDNKVKPKIITISSGKGGVGKSNLVVNLSITLQKMGKKVLIFDADIGMGNDDVLMGVLPKYNIFDIIFNNKRIEDVIITGPYGVKLLPAGTGLSRIEELSEKQRENFMEKLEEIAELDYIIMDTGAGINRTVLAFISCCDEFLILTTPEPTSLIDAYSLLKAVKHFQLKKDVKVIINRAIDDIEVDDTYKKFSSAISNFLQMDVLLLGKISEDRRLVQAVRKQEPFVISYPNCNAAKDIYAIANKLEGIMVDQKVNGVQGLFRKIFKIFS